MPSQSPRVSQMLELTPFTTLSPFLPIPYIQVENTGSLSLFLFFYFHNAQDLLSSHMQPRIGSLDGDGLYLFMFFCYQHIYFLCRVFHFTSYFFTVFTSLNLTACFYITLCILCSRVSSVKLIWLFFSLVSVPSTLLNYPTFC